MKIENSVALVTGANKPSGIGRALVEALLKAGAKKVYVTARDHGALDDLVSKYPSAIIPLALDITEASKVAAVATQVGDIDLLVNNAGSALFAGLIAADDLTVAHQEMEVNYFGTLAMVRAFAPVLKANGGGVIVNIASIAGLVNMPFVGSYSASKAAVHSMTQGVRAELAGQRTKVIGVYPGPVDTDMVTDLDMPKASPASIAQAVLAAIVAGTEDIFPDSMATEMRAALLSDPKSVERQCAEMLPTV